MVGDSVHRGGITTMMNNKIYLVLAAAMLLSVGLVSADSHLLEPFTQTELNDNWEADRYFPTDGVTSETAFDRDNVARIGIDSEQTQPGTFQRTEGIKTVGDQNFGDTVQVDLYLDPAWEDTAVRAGLWVVGDNGADARDERFGIIEFVNLEPSDSGISAIGDHEGWRIWDSVNGWTNLGTEFAYGEWVTLKIELNAEDGEYVFSINDAMVGNGVGGENFIREVFLNSYNYGLDAFPNLNSDSYAAHWHVGLEQLDPQSKQDCMKGGWEAFEFKNQGQCIRFVNTGKDSR